MNDKEFSDLQKKLKKKASELEKLKKSFFKKTGKHFFGISMNINKADEEFTKLQKKIEKKNADFEKLNKMYFKQTGKKFII